MSGVAEQFAQDLITDLGLGQETLNEPVAEATSAVAEVPELPVTEEAPAEVPAAEVPTAPETPAIAESLDVDELLDGAIQVDEAEAQTLGIDINAPRGKQLWRDHKLVEQLQKPVKEGGLGHLPSAEELSSYYQSHLFAEQLQADLNAEDPSRFLVGIAGMNPQAFAKMGEMMPEMLRQRAPEAFKSVVHQVSEYQEKQLLRHAQTKSYAKEYREYLFNQANFLRQWRLGKEHALTPDVMEIDPNAPDPNAPDLERQELEQYRQREMQSAFEAHRVSTSQAIQQTTEQFVTDALAPIKDKVAAKTYEAIAQSLRQGAAEAVSANPEVAASIKNKLALAKQNVRNPQVLARIQKDMVAMWRAHVYPWINANRKGYIKEHMGKLGAKVGAPATSGSSAQGAGVRGGAPPSGRTMPTPAQQAAQARPMTGRAAIEAEIMSMLG